MSYLEPVTKTPRSLSTCLRPGSVLVTAPLLLVNQLPQLGGSVRNLSLLSCHMPNRCLHQPPPPRPPLHTPECRPHLGKHSTALPPPLRQPELPFRLSMPTRVSVPSFLRKHGPTLRLGGITPS